MPPNAPLSCLLQLGLAWQPVRQQSLNSLESGIILDKVCLCMITYSGYECNVHDFQPHMQLFHDLTV